MATRFYLTSRSINTYLAQLPTDWEAGLRWGFMASTVRYNTVSRTLLSQESLANVLDTLAGVWVSERLAAQSISGTVKGIIRVLESAATNDMRAQVLIRVVSGDYATVRGVLLAHNAGALASEFSTTLQNRKFPFAWAGSGEALSSVNALEGDRIHIEIGARSHSTSTATISFSMDIGDPYGSDLAEDETSTTAANPWMEFSQDLTFLPAYDRPTRVRRSTSVNLARSNAFVSMVGTGNSYSGKSLIYTPDTISPRTVDSERMGSAKDVTTIEKMGNVVTVPASTVGGGGGAIIRYKKRARDSGAPSAVYVSWVSTDPTSAYPNAPPFGGPLVEEIIAESWVT